MPDLDEMQAALGSPVRAIGNGVLNAARWRQRDVDNTIPCDGSVRLIFPLTQTQRVWHQTKRGTVKLPIQIGTPTILDPGDDLRAIVEGEFDILAVSVTGWATPASPALEAFPDPSRQQVRARMLRRLLILMHDCEMQDAEELDSWAIAFRDALTSRGAPDKPRHGGLTRRQVQAVEDLVEARLDRPVDTPPSLAEMASAAGLSVYHFAREFRRATSVTPYAFALNRRLKRVEALLVRSTLPISLIAHRYGFASSAHFVKRFRDHMGVTPARYRQVLKGDFSPVGPSGLAVR